MRLIIKTVFLMILALPSLLAGMAFLAIDTQPAINRAAEVTPSSIKRAKRILDQNDPRKLKSGVRRTITVNAGDLDLAANYLAHQYAGGSARIELQNGSAQLGASLRAPYLPVSLYLNIFATLTDQAPLPRIEALRIGKLPIPSWLASWLISRGPELVGVNFELGAFDKVIRQIAIKERGVALTYEWQEDSLKNLRAAMLPAEEQKRIASYQELLVSIAQKHSSKNVSLIEFLVPFFQLARERSAQSDAIAENRAAILVLTVYVNGKNFDHILPEMKSRQRPAQHELLLSQRDDFAKHFIVSAALAASAGSPLANAVGLYKEIADSQGGSGFSFNDIAADRAGTRFGEVAANGASAKKLHVRVGAGISESDLMPATADLPEFMAEAEFKRRFGGVDGPEYKKMMADIERRIAMLPLYR